MAGPFFIPDLSAWEGPRPNFDAIAAAPNHVGCIIKATQGVTYSPKWFTDNWPRVRAAGGGRYGKSWFRGCFHFASPTPSGGQQADYMLAAVEKAGGWGEGDLPPAWDLEDSKTVKWTSRQEVVDRSAEFSERVKQRLGREPILYTGSTWRKLVGKGAERAGFNALWSTHLDLMVPYGWPNSSLVLYQYVGDGKYWNPRSTAALAGYPTGVPGIGTAVDMNVVMDGGMPATSIDRVRAVLLRRDGLGAYDVTTLEQDLRQTLESARRTGKKPGTLTPVLIGGGLLFAGVLLARYYAGRAAD